MERWTLGRVRLNSGGYDARGEYFGVGAPFYRYNGPDGEYGHVRAHSREDAKAAVRAKYPAATFYR